MTSLKISPDQLQRVKQARIERGLAIDHPHWLMAASKILKPMVNWEKDEKLAISIGSWKRFLNGKPIKPSAFKAFCQILGLDWQEVVDVLPLAHNRVGSAKCDWGEAPAPSLLVGRALEVATLKQWIVIDRVRLVSVLGVGGIGKTSLVSKVMREIAGEFDHVIWRSLSEAPPVEQLLDEFIGLLLPQRPAEWSPVNAIATDDGVANELPASLGKSITVLIDLLNTARCLLVVDGIEAILPSGFLTGNYHFPCDGYRELLRRLGESAHQSCLIVTGREQVRELRRLHGISAPVRVMKLDGLRQEATEILHVRGVVGSKEEMAALIDKYHGNPLALEIVSATIKNTFNNDIVDFLKVPIVFGEIKDLLMVQSQRLSEIEKMVICWLVKHHQPATCHEIAASLSGEVHSTIIEALDSLLDRSLIQLTEEGFMPQNMVTEYVIQHHSGGL